MVVNLLALAAALMSSLQTYYPAGQAVLIKLDPAAVEKAQVLGGIGADKPLKLVLLSPQGAVFASAAVERKGDPINLSALFDSKNNTYAALHDGRTRYVQLFAGDTPIGSPLVIIPIRALPGVEAGAVRVQTERSVLVRTDQGEMTLRLDYDAAPNTCMNFVRLVEDGFYDGVVFHRVVPTFAIQTGDPTGTGRGSAGYGLKLEVSDKKHNRGTVSMARSEDPNSAATQFFVCLSREHCKPLDGKYAAFGDVISGMETVDKIAATPIANAQTGAPVKPPVIQKVELVLAAPRAIDPKAKKELRTLTADITMSSNEQVESRKLADDALDILGKEGGTALPMKEDAGKTGGK